MQTIYEMVKEFARKYPGTIAWRKKAHAKIIKKHLNPPYLLYSMRVLNV